MAFVHVDWSKPQEGDFYTGILPRELSCEGNVVLHGSLLLQQGSHTMIGGSLAAPTAVALAEVNAVDDVGAWVHVPPEGGRDDGGKVRVRIRATRLRLRMGEPLVILHPFVDVERIFRTYRMLVSGQ